MSILRWRWWWWWRWWRSSSSCSKWSVGGPWVLTGAAWAKWNNWAAACGRRWWYTSGLWYQLLNMNHQTFCLPEISFFSLSSRQVDFLMFIHVTHSLTSSFSRSSGCGRNTFVEIRATNTIDPFSEICERGKYVVAEVRNRLWSAEQIMVGGKRQILHGGRHKSSPAPHQNKHRAYRFGSPKSAQKSTQRSTKKNFTYSKKDSKK